MLTPTLVDSCIRTRARAAFSRERPVCAWRRSSDGRRQQQRPRRAWRAEAVQCVQAAEEGRLCVRESTTLTISRGRLHPRKRLSSSEPREKSRVAREGPTRGVDCTLVRGEQNALRGKSQVLCVSNVAGVLR